MRIRFMVEEDVEDVVEIENQLFSKPWTKQDFINSMMDKHNIYVVAADEKDKPIGYCGVWGVIDEGQVTNVAVSPSWQGQGIGFQMLNEILNMAREEGLKDFTLEVRESNGNAIKLYEKLGFMKEGIRKNYYEKPTEDGIIMWLREQLDS